MLCYPLQCLHESVRHTPRVRFAEAWVSLMSRASSRHAVHVIAVAVLFLATLSDVLQLIASLSLLVGGGSRGCAAFANVHVALEAISKSALATTQLRNTVPQYIPATHLQLHSRLRRAASTLVYASNVDAGCHARDVRYPLYEWSVISRYPLDGVLFYIFSVIGAKSRNSVEIDDAHGEGIVVASAGLSILHGWNTLLLYTTWSAQNVASKLFAQRDKVHTPHRFSESHFAIREIRPQSSAVFQALREEGISGEIDLLMVYTDSGLDFDMLRESAAEVRLRPRVVVAFYQDYWGADSMKARIANVTEYNTFHPRGGRDAKRPLPYAGASIRALVQSARELHLRLAWCLSKFPIAIFVSEEGLRNDRLLPTLTEHECIAKRYQDPFFRRDMEVQWDYAQRFDWNI